MVATRFGKEVSTVFRNETRFYWIHPHHVLNLAAMAITSTMYTDADNGTDASILFDTHMLERYILLCAQDIHGGLRDKPSKSRDFYHTCYNLSGLSIAQNERRLEKTDPCFNIRIERVKEVLAMRW